MKGLQRKWCLDENNQENAIFVSVFLFPSMSTSIELTVLIMQITAKEQFRESVAVRLFISVFVFEIVRVFFEDFFVTL